MLKSRQKLVLKAIIEEYIRSYELVGSKFLSEKPFLPFSPATIRYDMQELEETGYLEKLHTSSGRRPSDLGYKYYLANLLTFDYDLRPIYEKIDRLLDDKTINKEQKIVKLLKYLSHELNALIHIKGRSNYYSKVKKLEIVPLDNGTCLLLVVTNFGTVETEIIKVPKNFNTDDLLRVIEMFDLAMYDQEIIKIQEILTREARKPKIRQMFDFRDDVLNFMVKAFSNFLEPDSYYEGLIDLLRQPDNNNLSSFEAIFKIFNNEENLNKLLKRNRPGLNVFIGEDNKELDLVDFTIISNSFSLEANERGFITLVGPKRLNYAKAIPLIEYLALNLKKIYE